MTLLIAFNGDAHAAQRDVARFAKSWVVPSIGSVAALLSTAIGTPSE
jgi:hypothetical protein